MDAKARRAAMKAAIDEARRSRQEDDRHHPMVGAVLTDAKGKILLSAHRGMDGNGGHAEYNLLAELDRLPDLDRSKLSLFVTLEPCSRRSEKKTPCAVRVARSGIGTIYVGTLDPNPQIIGRGVNHLISEGRKVEHFPADLRAEILELNATFQGTHAFLVDPVVRSDGEESPRQRAGILASTLDMIAGAEAEVLIRAGDASWLPKIFVALLEARLRQVRIRLIADDSSSAHVLEWAKAIGVEVLQAPRGDSLRATLTIGRDGPAGLMVVERRPARHALVFSAPHEEDVLKAFERMFEADWQSLGGQAATPVTPRLVPISKDDLFATLRTVRQYAEADFSITSIAPGSIARLTDEVEIFKLRRVASTLRILALSGVAEPVSIAGTPWGLFPPIVEDDGHGNLTLIDGVHRHHLSRDQSSMPVVLVRNVSAPLPAKPVRGSPRIVAGRSDRDDRYEAYDGRHFREIKKALEKAPWPPS